MVVWVVVEGIFISTSIVVSALLQILPILNPLPDEPESLDTALLISLPRAGYAAHDSSRGDAPSSCLEGTRVAILEEILSWAESANGERPPVYWLNGLAGIGKSTIAKTVAERAQGKAILGASFFFSRSDEPLRDPRLVFPTLAFDLAQSDSAFRTVIVEALRKDPKLGHKKLLHQIEGLILAPLSKVNPVPSPTLIILDALDECEEKGAVEILQLVFSHAIQIPFLRILITSRPQPHLSSVFSKFPNLEKTVLHDIDASLVQQDIRLYISTELAKIPGKLDLPMPADWATQNQTTLLVGKSGNLFIYAATAVRFISDDRMRDPPSQLSLILNTRSAQEVGATPYSQLDNLYMGVLRGSFSSDNRGQSLRRFQIVVGSIVLLREPLPLSSLARFVQYEPHVVEATLYHLHSVIIPPSDLREAPRIYHPSFLEFITDASRCSMPDFVIVPGPEQELRHAMRCFELMKKHLKQDVAGISDPSLLNLQVHGLKKKVADAFSTRSILWWFEAMSLIESVSIATSSIQEAHRWAVWIFLADLRSSG
jgi:NACHT domain